MVQNPTERYSPDALVRTVNSDGCAGCKSARCKLVSITRCYSADPLKERFTRVCLKEQKETSGR